jgi:hypothetical protein
MYPEVLRQFRYREHPGLQEFVTIHHFPFLIFPSFQRLFIANDSRLLPAGVSPERFFLFVVLPLGLPMRFLPPRENADPRSDVMA